MSIVTHGLLLLLLLNYFFLAHAVIDVSSVLPRIREARGSDIAVVQDWKEVKSLADQLRLYSENHTQHGATLCTTALVPTDDNSVCGSESCLVSCMHKVYDHTLDPEQLAENQMKHYLDLILIQKEPKNILDYARIENRANPTTFVVAEGTAPAYLDLLSLKCKYTTWISLNYLVTEPHIGSKKTGILTFIVHQNGLSRNYSSANPELDAVKAMLNEFRTQKYFRSIDDVTVNSCHITQHLLALMTHLTLETNLAANNNQTPDVDRLSLLLKLPDSFLTVVGIPTEGDQQPIERALAILSRVSNTEGLKLTPAGLCGAVYQKLSIVNAMLLSTATTLKYAIFKFGFAMEISFVVIQSRLEFPMNEYSWGAAHFSKCLDDINVLRQTHLGRGSDIQLHNTKKYEQHFKAAGAKVKELKSAAGSEVLDGMLCTWYRVEKATNYQSYAPPQVTIGQKLLSIYNQAKENTGFTNQDAILPNYGIEMFPENDQPKEPADLSGEDWTRVTHNNKVVYEEDETQLTVTSVSSNLSILDVLQMLFKDDFCVGMSTEGSTEKEDVVLILSLIYSRDYLCLCFDAVNLILTLQGKPKLDSAAHSGTMRSVEGIENNEELPVPGKFKTTSFTGEFDGTIVKCLFNAPINIKDFALFQFGVNFSLLCNAYQKHNLNSVTDIQFVLWAQKKKGWYLGKLFIQENKAIHWLIKMRALTNLKFEFDKDLRKEAKDCLQFIVGNSKDKQKQVGVEEETMKNENLQVTRAPPPGINVSSGFYIWKMYAATVHIFADSDDHGDLSQFINAVTNNKVLVSNLSQQPSPCSRDFLAMVNLNSDFDWLHMCKSKRMDIYGWFEGGVVKGFCILYPKVLFRDMGKILSRNTVGWTTALEYDDLPFSPQSTHFERHTGSGLEYGLNYLANYHVLNIEQSSTIDIPLAFVKLFNLLSVDARGQNTGTEVSTAPTFEMVVDSAHRMPTWTRVDVDLLRRIREKYTLNNFYHYSGKQNTVFVFTYALPDNSENNSTLISQFVTQIKSFHTVELRHSPDLDRIAFGIVDFVESEILYSSTRFGFSIIVAKHTISLVGLLDVNSNKPEDIIQSFLEVLRVHMSQEGEYALFTDFDLSSFAAKGFSTIQAKGKCSPETVKRVFDGSLPSTAGFHVQQFDNNSKLCTLTLGDLKACSPASDDRPACYKLHFPKSAVLNVLAGEVLERLLAFGYRLTYTFGGYLLYNSKKTGVLVVVTVEKETGKGRTPTEFPVMDLKGQLQLELTTSTPEPYMFDSEELRDKLQFSGTAKRDGISVALYSTPKAMT